MNATQEHSPASSTTPPQDSLNVRPALYRPAHGRMLAGVASGLAHYLSIDVTLIRIALVVLLFVGGLGLPLYLAGWLLIPDEQAGRSVADDFAADVRSWRD